MLKIPVLISAGLVRPSLRCGDRADIRVRKKPLPLTEIRKRVLYLEICDGNMEEGSLRCDANISVRRKGETRLGTKSRSEKPELDPQCAAGRRI